MTASILLVEDDDTARVLLSNVLKRAGYQVTAAANGERAIQLLNSASAAEPEGSTYDVVLTDIRMHGKDGIAVMHAASRQKKPPAVILMTGYGSIETAVAALRANAYDYLLKPCDTGDLLQCVAGAVQHRSADMQRADAVRMLTHYVEQLQMADNPHTRIPPRISEPSLQEPVSETAAGGERATRAEKSESEKEEQAEERFIQVGDLCLDLFRHTVTFHEYPLQVTPTEYTLLQCLAKNPGRVLRYHEIVQYTHSSQVSNNEAQVLLRAHVHNLRRKIDPSYLINVRGIGYMLVVPDEDTPETFSGPGTI